jgi:ribosomal-protein-alanine N-acetyltransferase
LITIELVSDDRDYEWSGSLMAGSDPWIKLGVSRSRCLQACRGREHLLFIARDQEHRLGIILLHPQGLAGSPYIKSVCVEADIRGRGIGEKLVCFAEDYFRKESKHIFLCVSSFNVRAKVFYERLGYKQVGEIKDYLIAGESELLMHKRIS